MFSLYIPDTFRSGTFTVSIITLVILHCFVCSLSNECGSFDNPSVNPSSVIKAVHCSHVLTLLSRCCHSFYSTSATLSICPRPLFLFSLGQYSSRLLEQITSLPLRPMTNDLPNIIIKMCKNASILLTHHQRTELQSSFDTGELAYTELRKKCRT